MVASRRKPEFPIIDWSHPLSKGLVAAYPFFEGRGDSRLFNLVNRNHGTFQGSPSWVTNKEYGRALSFSGTSDFVTMPALMSSSDTEVSCAMLVKGDTNSTQYRPIEYNNEGIFFDFILNSAASDKARWTVNGSGGSVNIETTASTASWMLLIGTAKENGSLNFYVNGVKQSATAFSDTFAVASTLGRNIAANRDGSSNLLAGDIADLRIWNRELSEGEAFNMFVDMWGLYTRSRDPFVSENVTVPLGEVSVVGDIGILADMSSVLTKEFNRVGSFGVNVELVGSVTKDFRNVQTFRGAMGIVADLDGVVSAQFTRERNGQIDIVAEFDSPVTFEKMKAGQIDAIVDLVASTTEGETPVTDQDIGEAIVFRTPKIDYVFRARKHPTGRRL